MARILIIDDDPLVRFALKRVLARPAPGQAGHALEEADGGAAALAVLRRETFDLALIDMVMPDMTGLDVLPALKAVQPGLRVIAISGGARNDNASLLSAAEQLGVHGVLRKPFTSKELFAAVEGALLAADPA